MRKKQVLALLLTGAMTFGTAPAAVFAAEETSAVSIEESGMDAGVETASEVPSEEISAPVETPAETPTEIPAETPAETPTETPAEVPTETPDSPETPSETPVPETPALETPSAEIPAADGNLQAEGVTVTPTETPAAPFSIGENFYNSLEEALAAVTTTPESEDMNTITVNQDLVISTTVTIPANKSVILAAPAGKTIKITRAAGFKGNMFEVNGGMLYFYGLEDVDTEGNDTKGTLIVDGSGDGSTAEGSVVSVYGNGSFALYNNASITGNSTTEKGSAIHCTDGSILLYGGSITNNKTSGLGGAIYSNSTVYVGGTVNVTGNTGADGVVSNIVLENDNTVTDPALAVTLNVFDALSNSTIGVQMVNPAAGIPVVTVDTDAEGMTMETALPQFTYDDAQYTLDSTGALKSADEPVPETLEAHITGSSWLSTSKVSINGTTNKNGLAYIKVVKTGSTAPTADEIIAANKHVDATTASGFTFSHTFSSEEKKAVGTDPVTVYVCVVSGEEKVVVSVDMDENSRPARVKGVSASWTGHDSAKIVCLSDKAGTAYWGWVKHGAAAPGIDKCTMVSTVTANANFDVYADNLDSEEAIDVYIYVKGNNGTISAPLVAQLNQSSRPANPTTAPSRDPIVPSVNESKVTGLENPLEFYPNTFYDFTVVGAGTQNTDPIEGDVRWVPLYWSTSSNPSDSEKHSTWKIGAKGGIKTADTFNMYIFYRQEKYTGNGWQATDNIVSVPYQFKSAAIEYDSVTPTPTAGENGYYGYDENGNPITRTDDTTDTGSVSATGAKTADESPIGTMSMLAIVSLLAGGYVITRKRKKITD